MSRIVPDPTTPSDRDAQLARDAMRGLQARRGSDLKLHVIAEGDEGAAIDLPETATAPLLEIRSAIAEGKSVAVSAIDTEITTQQADDLLNVSQPFLVDLVERGVLAARVVDNQCRLLLRDVLAYRRAARTKRLAALAELTKHDQELGLL